MNQMLHEQVRAFTDWLWLNYNVLIPDDLVIDALWVGVVVLLFARMVRK